MLWTDRRTRTSLNCKQSVCAWQAKTTAWFENGGGPALPALFLSCNTYSVAISAAVVLCAIFSCNHYFIPCLFLVEHLPFSRCVMFLLLSCCWTLGGSFCLRSSLFSCITGQALFVDFGSLYPHLYHTLLKHLCLWAFVAVQHCGVVFATSGLVLCAMGIIWQHSIPLDVLSRKRRYARSGDGRR